MKKSNIIPSKSLNIMTSLRSVRFFHTVSCTTIQSPDLYDNVFSISMSTLKYDFDKMHHIAHFTSGERLIF